MSGERFEENAAMPKIKFHRIHCPKCGKEFGADELAFDFGKIVGYALEKNRKLHQSWGEGELFEWGFLDNVNLKLYLSSLDLQREFGIELEKESEFIFSVSHLKSHILGLLKGGEKNTGNLVERFDDLVDTLPNPGGNDRIKDITFREQIVKLFCEPGSKDIDKKETLRQNLNFLKELRKRNDAGVIAKIKLKVCKTRDDQAAEILDRLKVTYEDEEVASYDVKVCPDCGNEFYREVGKYEEILIGMMGSARVGKTAYLAALVDRISFSNKFISLADRTDKGYLEFERGILNPYKRMVKIPKTEKEQEEIIPLFSIVLKLGDKKYAFVFIDMPGEVWDKENQNNFIVNKRKILEYVDIMWMCVAPEQVDPADHLEVDQGEDRVETDMCKMLPKMAGVLHAADLKKKPEAALIVTMSDKIGEVQLFDPDMDVMSEYLNGEEPYLDLEKTLEHGRKVKQFIEKNAQERVRENRAKLVLEFSQDLFSHLCYFAVAAYGGTPVPLGQEVSEGKKPHPSLIELPFLWSLAVCGCLSAGEEPSHMSEPNEKEGIWSKFIHAFSKEYDEEDDLDGENWESVSDKSRLFIG